MVLLGKGKIYIVAKIFLDTNILVYTVDDSPAKTTSVESTDIGLLAST